MLTACFETLEAICTFAEDIRGSPTCLKLRLGTLEATPTLIIGVLATLTAGGRGGTLNVRNIFLMLPFVTIPLGQIYANIF